MTQTSAQCPAWAADCGRIPSVLVGNQEAGPSGSDSGGLLADLLEGARRRNLSANSLAAYERTWTRFLAWTAAASFDPRSLPFPDTVSKVIHCRGRRAAAKPSSAAAPAVNNFAESAAELVKNLPLANNGRVRKAPRPARFSFPNPSRVCGRSPAGSRAAVQRSERTTSHEDSCIRSTSDGPPPSPQPQQNRVVKMQPWSKITHYAGFDWATRSS